MNSIGNVIVKCVEGTVNIIETIFKLNLPIGWNELGVIATVLAVVVALTANKKATEQLESALKMQEQSKNVGLLDKRIELAEAIQSRKSVSELTLQVLFNDEILKHYKAWQGHLTEKVYASHDLDRFYAALKEPDGEGGYYTDVQHTLEGFIADMSRLDCPQQISDNYEKYCKDHIVYLTDGETGVTVPYNHSEILTRFSNADKAAKKEQNITLQLIKNYTTDSIQPLYVLPKKKRFKWKFWKREG